MDGVAEAMVSVERRLASMHRTRALQWALARKDDELAEFFLEAEGTIVMPVATVWSSEGSGLGLSKLVWSGGLHTLVRSMLRAFLVGRCRLNPLRVPCFDPGLTPD